MAKMKKPFWNPKEKPNQKLLSHIDEKTDFIHQGLRTFYFGKQQQDGANLIHGTGFIMSKGKKSCCRATWRLILDPK